MALRRAIAPSLLSPLLILGAACAGLAGLLRSAVAQEVLPQPKLPQATRGPVRIAFTPAGDRALVAESDEATIAVMNPVNGIILRRIPTGGEQPSGLAATPDGAVVVTNSFSGSVALLDLATGSRRALVPLRGEPSDVVLSGDGRRAFVSLAQLDEVAVLDLPELKVAQRIRVGRRPRAMAITPDGSKVLVANLQGGDVSVLDPVSLREVRRVELTGVNLRGIAVTPDGERAYVTGQIPANTRLTIEPLDMWTNTVFAIDLRDRPGGLKADVGSEGWIDFSLGASPDPDGIVALDRELVAVALAGSDQALMVRTPGPHLRSYDPVIVRRVEAGARPRGIALTPDKKHLWVANELESTITVLDARSMKPLRKIALGVPERKDLRLEGRYIFGNARVTRGHQFTCASCHPNGGSDGLFWDFAHVPDGFPKRNTRNLRGGITLTAPFRWSGHNTDIEEFFQEEVVGLLQGPRQGHQALHALWNLVDQFPMPPNPYRQEDGGHSPQGLRGKKLFEGKAGCISCHAGEKQGGTGMKAWVGTTDSGVKLDVPHLHGVHDSSPYLHDARALSLEEIFEKFNPEGRHGAAASLSKEELSDLLRYVREL